MNYKHAEHIVVLSDNKVSTYHSVKLISGHLGSTFYFIKNAIATYDMPAFCISQTILNLHYPRSLRVYCITLLFSLYAYCIVAQPLIIPPRSHCYPDQLDHSDEAPSD